MTAHSATARAFANIAFIKYWGNRQASLRLPANGSISMNLAGLYAHTTVRFDEGLCADALTLNGVEQGGAALERVSAMLAGVRALAGLRACAAVKSRNNFPTGAGIASSAAAFAALSLAASAAAGLTLEEGELSRLARTGSGSACRSIPGGFVEWQKGEGDADSYAFSIAAPEHWRLVDCIAVVSATHKPTGSSEGHALADSSPYQGARVADAPRRLEICRRAILERDFEALAQVVEQDCMMMHAVMMTSTTALLYWTPATLEVVHLAREWRRSGLAVCYTMDAGANVHLICEEECAAEVAARAGEIRGVLQVLQAGVGGAATLCAEQAGIDS